LETGQDFLNTMSLKRTKRQIEAVNKWINSSFKGTFEFATGVGKTRAALIAIKKLIKIEKLTKESKIHIVVPTKYLQSQWNKEIKALKLSKLDIEVFVINTYIKQDRTCDFLILDEIHNYGSALRVKVFTMNYQYLLGLTATTERKDLMHSIILSYAPVVDRIDLKEARREQYVSDYVVYNLGITLSESDKMYYTFINQNFYKHYNVFGRDFNLAMTCMSNKNARERYATTSGLSSESIGYNAVRFNKFMQERKNFLYNLPSKLEVVKKIIEKFKVQTVTFSENTSFADKLSETIPNSASYHSKIPKADRNKTLQAFNDGRNNLHVINSSKALDEGADIPDVELILITSSRSVERVDIQRTGRGIRFKEGKLAVIVNIYVKNSKDEEWLKQRQNKTNNIFWVNDVTDIKFERPQIRIS
jgi:superfamily II DNA or RNA helicase